MEIKDGKILLSKLFCTREINGNLEFIKDRKDDSKVHPILKETGFCPGRGSV
jgi:hypothetical protein